MFYPGFFFFSGISEKSPKDHKIVPKYYSNSEPLMSRAVKSSLEKKKIALRQGGPSENETAKRNPFSRPKICKGGRLELRRDQTSQDFLPREWGLCSVLFLLHVSLKHTFFNPNHNLFLNQTLSSSFVSLKHIFFNPTHDLSLTVSILP